LARARKGPPVITLLTDFGLEDTYVGVMKGVILGICPQAVIVDLCHQVTPQDVFEAAYLLCSSHEYFPPGTIHVAVVDPGVGSSRRIICAEAGGHRFLAPDNGLLSLTLKEVKLDTMVEVSNKDLFLDSVSSTFHGRDIFAPVAAHLAMGADVAKLGKPAVRIRKVDFPKPVRSAGGRLKGRIIHVDRFGNLVTNLTHLVLHGVLARPGKLTIRVGRTGIEGISKSYADADEGGPLALFGSTGHLEISVNQGSAAEKLKVQKGATIEVVPQ